MFAFAIMLIGLPVIKNSNWRRIQNQIVHCEAGDVRQLEIN